MNANLFVSLKFTYIWTSLHLIARSCDHESFAHFLCIFCTYTIAYSNLFAIWLVCEIDVCDHLLFSGCLYMGFMWIFYAQLTCCLCVCEYVNFLVFGSQMDQMYVKLIFVFTWCLDVLLHTKLLCLVDIYNALLFNSKIKSTGN